MAYYDGDRLMPGQPLPKTLSPIQNRTKKFSVAFSKKYGWAPTVAEMASHFGYVSTSTIQIQLDYMERKGFIARGHSPRAIRVVERGAKISRTGATKP